MPVRVAGGIADLTHPKFRLSVHADGNLAQLKRLVPKTAQLPMRGPVQASLLVEGSVKQPLVLISLRSPGITYRGIPLSKPHGLLAFDGQEADVFGFQLGYQAFSLTARGRMALKSQPNAVEMTARIHGPSDAVPYASSLISRMQLHGTILATGSI